MITKHSKHEALKQCWIRPNVCNAGPMPVPMREIKLASDMPGDMTGIKKRTRDIQSHAWVNY